MKRKLLAAFLSLCMTLTLVPTALAAEEPATPTEGTGVATQESSNAGGTGSGGEETGGDAQSDGKIDTQAELKTALDEAGKAEGETGKTVTLGGDIALSNAGLTANAAAITVPVGVTLDGGGHTLSIGEAWSKDIKNHILSVENASENTETTIKNLTITGNEKTKSGIHVYSCKGTVKLDTVTIKNCANAALLVNGSTVEAKELNTEGNAWGAVNVDKGSGLENAPSFKLESGTLQESAKIWTEIENDQSESGTKVTITVPKDWASAMPSYDGKTYYVDQASVSVKIGTTPYATLRDAALAAAKDSSSTDKTITLCADVTVTNKETQLSATDAVILLPDGWTLDGQNHTITAAEDWEATEQNKPKNPILGMATTTTNGVTIKDVKIVGNKNTKHGINAWTATAEASGQNTPGTLTLENVTIEKCGTAGMVIQNTKVTASGLTTSGNAWGAVNVDSKGAPELTLTGANLGENVQLWTELETVSAEKITINDEAFQQVKGVGEDTLKGFTYYTTDPAKLGEASVTTKNGTTVYDTLETALADDNLAENTTIKLLKDVTLKSPITLDKKGLTLDGQGKKISYSPGEGATTPTTGALITIKDKDTDADSGSGDGITVKNLTVDAGNKAKYGVQFYCVDSGTLDGVTVKGGTYSSVLVNGAKAKITGCALVPADGAYANIEYGMGTEVTTQPEITLSNVTGDPDKHLVYADKVTADKIEGNSEKTYAQIANEINNKLTGVKVTLVIKDSSSIEEIMIPGTEFYTVTFNGNGVSTVSPSTLVTNSDGKLTDSLPIPTRSGYTFEGWYTEANGGTKVSDNHVFDKDMTLYAHWKSTGGSSSGSGSSGSGSSGGGGGSVVTKYTLTFDTNGGTAISKVTKDKGTKVDLSSYTTTRQGYTFAGWYADKALTDKVTSVTLNSNQTVYAKWTEKTPEKPALPFTDVTKGDWFYDAVQYVYDKGMMNGVDGGRFAPNATTSRAMIVTILYRLENEPAVSGKSPFTDVAAGQWYTNAVAWAAANGIVTGTTDTTFAPNGNITREQMAAILYRYASYKGLDVSRQADLSGYADANAISAYAKQAMAWANGQGLITGVTATTLRPDGNAVRAQAATILMRLCEQVL